MKEELEKRLVKAFPKLYKEYGGDVTKTCMAWGFECGDGWFDLLWKLSGKLESLGVVAAQVKEKYGTLRFYLETYNEEAEKYIDEAEAKSEITCEICGEPGKIGGKGWISVKCEQHRK